MGKELTGRGRKLDKSDTSENVDKKEKKKI